MITQPESNIKLETEQETQLAYVQSKLENFQNEIQVAIKTLTETRLVLDSVVKEKDYQTELVSNLTEMVDELRNRKEKFQSEIQESVRVLNENTQKSAVLTSEHTTKQEALKLREDALVIVERNYEERVRDLKVKEVKVEEKRLEVERAQKALLEALKTITWR